MFFKKIREHIAMNKEDREYKKERNSRYNLWNTKFNLVTSEDGLWPYIEKIKDRIDPKYYPEKQGSLIFAVIAMQLYFDDLKEAGASEELILTAYGQYLWETYVAEAVYTKIKQWEFENDKQELCELEAKAEDGGQNDPSSLDALHITNLKNCVQNPFYLSSLAKLISTATTGHFDSTLAINYQNKHTYTPVDALKLFFQYADAWTLMDQYLDLDKPEPTMEQVLKFSYSDFTFYSHRSNRHNTPVHTETGVKWVLKEEPSLTAQIIHQHDFDVLQFSIDFLTWICDRWTDYIAEGNFLAALNTPLSDQRLDARDEKFKLIDDPVQIQAIYDYDQANAFWKAFDVLEFFGFSLDNLPEMIASKINGNGLSLEESFRVLQDNGVDVVRNLEKYPVGYFVPLLTA